MVEAQKFFLSLFFCDFIFYLECTRFNKLGKILFRQFVRIFFKVGYALNIFVRHRLSAFFGLDNAGHNSLSGSHLLDIFRIYPLSVVIKRNKHNE